MVYQDSYFHSLKSVQTYRVCFFKVFLLHVNVLIWVLMRNLGTWQSRRRLPKPFELNLNVRYNISKRIENIANETKGFVRYKREFVIIFVSSGLYCSTLI